MNIPHTQLAAIVACELQKLESENPGTACILEFKLATKDGTRHAYIQMLLIKEPKKNRVLWRKYRENSSLTHGETLWEDTEEFDSDILAGSRMMIDEKISDMAFKAKVENEKIILSLESIKTVVPDRISHTHDSKHSYIVKVSRKQKHFRHV